MGRRREPRTGVVRHPRGAGRAAPVHVDIQRDLAIAYEKLANVQRARGDGAGAVESYRGALAQFERLAQTDPQNAIAARSVGISREKLADTLASLARTGEALDLLRAALGTYRRLGERDPDNAQTRCDRGRVAERLADLLATAASGREACSLWQESLDVTKELLAIRTATCVSSEESRAAHAEAARLPVKKGTRDEGRRTKAGTKSEVGNRKSEGNLQRRSWARAAPLPTSDLRLAVLTVRSEAILKAWHSSIA